MTLYTMLSAGLLGAMLFFAGIVAPSVFRFLESETAGRFLRGLFPRYYLFGLAVSILALALALHAFAFLSAGVLAAVAAGFAIARFGLVPRIDAARDGERAGDQDSAKRFKRLHRVSVLINLVQMLALAALLGRVLAAGT